MRAIAYLSLVSLLPFLLLTACKGGRSSAARCSPGVLCPGGPDAASPAGDASGTDGGVFEGGDSGFRVKIEDRTELEIEVLVLQCAGDCARLRAVAHGGRPPYNYAWEDGSTSAEREVCLQADTTLSVTARDTPIVTAEFELPQQSTTTILPAEVIGCSTTDTCEPLAPGPLAPSVEWTWGEGLFSMTTPLVANLSDDDGNGTIDADDVPDVVLVAGDTDVGGATPPQLVVLDGASGREHWRQDDLKSAVVPAVGDIDGDGVVEIVAVAASATSVWGRVVAYEHDGTLAWTGDDLDVPGGAVTLADLDGDGSVEVLAGRSVFGASGGRRWAAGQTQHLSSIVAVDLDADGFLEVLWGSAAYRHDGTLYFSNAEVADASVEGGDATASNAQLLSHSAVADLDADGDPEIVVTTVHGVFVLDHRGATLSRRAIVDTQDAFPPAIADLDGDGAPELAFSEGSVFSAVEGDLSPLWSAAVQDVSGAAGCSAFDLTGDGVAEVLHADESTFRLFAGATGEVLDSRARPGSTGIESPVVADVDGDGSAEVLIPNGIGQLFETGPALRVLGHAEGRWPAARRIYNQHAYHITNVNDDGTIPASQEPPWRNHNTFRAQARVGGDAQVCTP